MSNQLDQLLGYLERDGVTEILFGTGRPIAMRTAQGLSNLTARPLTSDQVAVLVRTEIAQHIPSVDGDSDAFEVKLGKRRAIGRVARRGAEIVVSLRRAEGAPGLTTTQPLARVAAAPQATTEAPSRADGLAHGATQPLARVATSASVDPADPAGVRFSVKSAMPSAAPPAVTGSGTMAAAKLPAVGSGTMAAARQSPPSTLELQRTVAEDAIDIGDLADAGKIELDYGPAGAPPASSSTQRFGLAAAGAPLAATSTQLVGLAAAGPIASERPARATSPPIGLAAAGPIASEPRARARSPSSGLSAAGPIASERPRKATTPPSGLAAALAPARGDQTFDALVRAATQHGASDLHIAAGRITSLRVIGELVPLDAAAQPLQAAAVEAMLLPLLDDGQRAQLARSGYVDLALDAPSGGRLRANISRHQLGLKGTFRLALGAPATLDQLGLPAELAKVVAHHQGLVIVAGPSGHGKTTTLAALVDLLNSSRPYHILTIEDPIEIVHPRKQAVVSQRETGRHTESFARGLKASLREDPDVIVIGELRDRESVEIALTAAETGHLVIATMSTPSAAKTIDRLVDMFPPEEHSQVRASVAGALRAIVAQRLLPRRGGGVVPAIELVTGVLPLAVMIREDKLYQLPNLLQRGRAFGMIRFDESLAEHVRAGRLDEDTALAAAESKKDLAAALRPAAPDAGAAAKTSPLWGFGKKEQR